MAGEKLLSHLPPGALNEFTAAVGADGAHRPGAFVTESAFITANMGHTVYRQRLTTAFAFGFHL